MIKKVRQQLLELKRLYNQYKREREEKVILRQNIYTSLYFTKEDLIRCLELTKHRKRKALIEKIKEGVSYTDEEYFLYEKLIYGKTCARISKKVDQGRPITFDEYVIYATKKYPKLAEHQVKWFAYSQGFAERLKIKLPHKRGTAPYLEVLREANLFDNDQEMGMLYFSHYYGQRGLELYQKWYCCYAEMQEKTRRIHSDIKNKILREGCDCMSKLELQEFYTMQYGERAWKLKQKKYLSPEEKNELRRAVKGEKAVPIKRVNENKSRRHNDIDYGADSVLKSWGILE